MAIVTSLKIEESLNLNLGLRNFSTHYLENFFKIMNILAIRKFIRIHLHVPSDLHQPLTKRPSL